MNDFNTGYNGQFIIKGSDDIKNCAIIYCRNNSKMRNIHFLVQISQLHYLKINTFTSLSSPPGDAADYEGFVYFDTSVSLIVFSNGTNWYKVTSDII